MNKKTVRFKAMVVVKKPTTVKFTTKDGQHISFKATKLVAQEKIVKFKANPKKK